MAKRDATTHVVNEKLMGNHFLQLQTSERNVARFGDAIRVGGGRIDPRIERDMCNSVIAAVCATHECEPSMFEMQLVLRPGACPADAGMVTLAVSYMGPPAPGLDTAELREFCQRELLDRMPEVHQASQRFATGDGPIPMHAARPSATMPLPFDVKPVGIEQLAEPIGIASPHDPGQVARDTLSLQLVERLPGRIIPLVQAATGDGQPQQIGGVKILKPQRRDGPEQERVYYGYVNALSLHPATIEIKASEIAGDSRAVKLKLVYRFDPTNVSQLVELLALGSQIRVRFVVLVSTEVGVGAQQTRFTLDSWQRYGQAFDERAAA